MVWSFILVVICIAIFGMNLWISVQARSPEAMGTWAICLTLVVTFFILMSLHLIGLMSQVTYLRLTRPLVLPSIATIWTLPGLEWMVRMLKANKVSKEL